jgi:CheY-like chemotaxis protein
MILMTGFLWSKPLGELGTCVDLHFVQDGEELMDYLLQSGKYGDAALSPRPELIFLYLNMPKMDRRQALEEIKAKPVVDYQSFLAHNTIR